MRKLQADKAKSCQTGFERPQGGINPPSPLWTVNPGNLADLRDLAEEAREREKDSYLHSERPPVVASDQNVVTCDPTGRNVVEGAKSNSNEGAKEATRAKLYLTPCNEVEQQHETEKMKRKP
ncbi:hypothetical protein M5K25_005451 [Dendrobium thyrsiflorum]|uniref:Uncharacterized protein n=1 Tax=Dendrobium thyrsiflorum TaxID=117978 RepID=A0ABD0VPS7_DENTH